MIRLRSCRALIRVSRSTAVPPPTSASAFGTAWAAFRTSPVVSCAVSEFGSSDRVT